jgi:uncharacterized membrane protein YozB (DUF420 family)
MPERPTLTLLAYIFVLMPGMLLGFYFARRKMFQPYHKLTMTTVTIVNWVLILWLMVVSYAQGVLPNLPSRLVEPTFLLPTIHLITGAIAQFTATYLVILMWTERTRFEKLLPYRIKNIKTPMRVTLALWLTTIALGVAIYAVWYASPSSNSDAQAISTEEPAATEDANALSTEEAPAATEAAPVATEDSDDAEDAAEDATKIAEDANEDATKTAEDAAEDATKAAEDAQPAATEGS